MALFPTRKSLRTGTLLVFLQLGLLLLLTLLALPAIFRFAIPLSAWLLAMIAVALALWTLRHNRVGNFSIHPKPKASGVLVTTGPYRWIRHPMYSSVLLGAAALALLPNPLAGWASWTALAVVLLLKSSLEEDWLQQRHPAYAAYMQHSKRILPWVF
jgi:protein-S-isoprenylcysteine O-methyltransferase Ste14